MMMRTFAVILAMSGLALADDEIKQRVQIAKTEHVDFPSGRTVRLQNSTGELTVEGWDQPGVEITTVKSTKAEYAPAEREKATHELDRVKFSVERKGDELVINTKFPKSRVWPPYHSIWGGATNFDLDYHIRVPRDTRLVVEHYVGEAHFDGLTGDIHATALQGGITLHLPEEGQYTIDAKSNLGNVISDFPGNTKRRQWLGHEFIQSSRAPHALYLRDRFGDIFILKSRKPPSPPPLGQ